MNTMLNNTLTNSENNRVLEIAGGLNFRDLGGYISEDGRQTAWRKVFRSAQLNQLQPEGVQSIANLGIDAVIDLRFDEESEVYPTMRHAFPKATFYTWRDELADATQPTPNSDKMRRSWRDSLESGDPDEVREAMRINYPTKLYSHRGIYRRMLLRLIEGDTLLFHCAAGKDRTGVAAALILSLLGVDYDQIVTDYLLTQSLIEGRMETWLAGGATDSDKYENFQKKLTEQPKELLKPVLDADISYIQTLLEYVDSTYGSFESYATKQLELSQDQLQALRNNLLVSN